MVRYLLLLSLIVLINAECLPNEVIIQKLMKFSETKGIPKSFVLRVNKRIAKEGPCICHQQLDYFLETLWRMRMQSPEESMGVSVQFNKLSFCCECGFHFCCSLSEAAGKACFEGTSCPRNNPCM